MTLPLFPNGRRYGALECKPDPTNSGVALLSLPKVISICDHNLAECCGPFRDRGDLGAYTRSPVPE
jgi:hypothetical protein